MLVKKKADSFQMVKIGDRGGVTWWPASNLLEIRMGGTTTMFHPKHAAELARILAWFAEHGTLPDRSDDGT